MAAGPVPTAGPGPGWAVNGRFLSEPFSGVQRVSTGLLRWLAAHRAETLLVCPSGHRPQWWAGPVREGPLPPGRPGRLLWEQLVVPVLAGGRRVLSPANTAPLLRRDLVLVHDLAFVAHPEWFRPSFRRSYGAVTVRAARRARRVLVPSEFSASELVGRLGVPAARITVIRPGVDDSFRPAPEQETARVRAAYGLPPSFLLCVGSVDPRKGLDTAAAVAREVGMALVVAGAHPASFTGPALAGDVQWTGRVPDGDLPALYGAAAVLLYPSRYEGFGLPPLEAMACGTPVVASDLAVLRETLAGAALLADVDDVAAWSAAVRRALAPGTRDQLVGAGRQRAADYTWDRAGRRLAAAMDAWSVP